MNARRLALVALLGSSCASAGPLPLPDQSTSRSAPLCWFNDATWTSRGPLRAPFGTEPVVEIRYRQKRPWPKVNGVLRSDGGAVVFEAVLRGDGITVRGELDVSKEPLLYAVKRTPLEGVGILEPHAHVQVVGGQRDAIVIGPSVWALDSVHPVKPAVATVRCAEVTLGMKVQPFDETNRRLESLGFAKDAPVREVPKGKGARLHAAPNGPVVAEFPPRDFPHVLRLLGTEGEWSHVAQVDWTGVTWIGWMKNADLAELPDSNAGGILGGLALGSRQRTEPPRLHACAARLALGVRSKGKLERIGELDPGVPFVVSGEPREGVVTVTLPEGWIAPAKDVELVLPEEAMICPAAAPATGP